MIFKKYFESQELLKRNFFYIILPDERFKAYLKGLQDELIKTNSNLGEPVKENDFHVTIRGVDLSMDQTADEFVQWLKLTPIPRLQAFTEKFSILNNEAVALELQSDDIRNWYGTVNNWLAGNGYNKDKWNRFRPHISLFYKTGLTTPPPFYAKYNGKKIDFSGHRVTDQDLKVLAERWTKEGVENKKS